jgi:signal transduction histidine kinase
METLSNAKRACAVAAAAAHDFNNELTVILSSAADALASLDAADPARVLLLDIQAAAQRCVWKASGLLNFSARVNPDPVRASFEFLILE